MSWRGHDGEEVRVEVHAGRVNAGDRAVTDATMYDLAALTRSVIAMAALRMAARGDVDLREPVATLLPEVRGGLIAGTPLSALFSHRGGLAEWGALYLDVPRERGSGAARRWILSEAARRPGPSAGHSDLGSMIAGEALARAVGSTLDEVVTDEVSAPLGVEVELLYPAALPSEKRAVFASRCAPTERCMWRGRLVEGAVLDENAAALGGVAGHAGLFGTAGAVARFGRAVVDGELFDPDHLEEALADPGDGSYLRFGWDMKHGSPPPCGRRMSASAFGQIGFTGTSLYCDPGHDVVIALLTNRVCPSRANERIDGFRPAFHDGVMAALAG